MSDNLALPRALSTQCQGQVDSAVVGYTSTFDLCLTLEGWLLFFPEKPVHVLAGIPGGSMVIMNSHYRADVAGALPHLPHAGESGFSVALRLRSSISSTGFLSFLAYFADGSTFAGQIPYVARGIESGFFDRII